MSNVKAWIGAARLRTLPLAVSGILTGYCTAIHDGFTNPPVLVLLVVTSLLLQVLSNFANDYGDFLKGTDNDARVGPARALQSGNITRWQMRIAILVTVILTLVSGITLVIISLGHEQLLPVMGFITLGLAAIAAAVNIRWEKMRTATWASAISLYSCFLEWCRYVVHTISQVRTGLMKHCCLQPPLACCRQECCT